MSNKKLINILICKNKKGKILNYLRNQICIIIRLQKANIKDQSKIQQMKQKINSKVNVFL